MSKEIYIVTAGKYSDYHICKCFSTYESAEKYCQYLNVTNSFFDTCVETYNLVEGEDPDAKLKEPVDYRAIFNPEHHLYSLDTFLVYKEEPELKIEEIKAPGGSWIDIHGRVEPRQGEDPEEFRKRIEKIAIDRFYQFLAERRII